MRCEYLSPYSPDFNPVELGFSKIKAYLRRHGALLRALGKDEVSIRPTMEILLEAIYQITPSDTYGYFRHCGYLN
jgi:transposase